MNLIDSASPFDVSASQLGPSSLAVLPPILVADDDEDDRYFTMRLIKKIGLPHPILPFDDGIGVVDYLSHQWLEHKGAATNQPRLLFLDLKMSGSSGFSFLEWVREHRARAALNIVILSGSDEPQDVERAKRLGANRYLVKHPGLATFTTIVHDAHRAGPIHRDQAPGAFLVSRWQDEVGNELRQRR